MVTAAEVFDRKALALKRQRTAQHFVDYDFLFEFVQKQISDRLKDINRDFKTIIQIGARGTTGSYKEQNSSFTIDLHQDKHREKANAIADEEFLPFKNDSIDLVMSNLGLHATNDLPGTLIQIRRALKGDGLFMGAMFGGETLFELRESLMQTEIKLHGGASPRVFPFADKQQMGALLQRAGFALPVIDSEIITVTYPNMFKLMKDLRGMGETNIIKERSKKYPGRDFFNHAAQYYEQHFAEKDGRIHATFEIIFLIGWSPHESQQQPLKPGSAEKRLADVLGTNEIKTEEKATP